MADNSLPSPSPVSASSASSTSNSVGQSLSWSLQNFPVPVQLQARIPTSPLSVAQELLPNFPTHLMEREQQTETQQQQHEQTRQYYLSLQQQMQQQLQQRLQRQLQLNLQGGGEPSHSVTMPDPPDSTLDTDLPGGPRLSTLSSRAGSSGGNDSNPTNRNWAGGLRGALNSANLGVLDAFFRSNNPTDSNPNTHSNSLGAGRTTPGNSDNNGLVSRHATGSSTSSVPHSLGQGLRHHNNSNPHHHHHNQVIQSTTSAVVGGGESGSGNNLEGSQGEGVVLNANSGNHGTGNAAPGPAPNSAELSMLYKWLTESGIFVILLLLHFLYDHRLGLLVFLCTGGTFYYTNMKLVHAIHLSAVRDSTRSWSGFLNLLWLSGFLMANVIILYYVFAEQRLWGLLFYQMAAVTDINVWTLLWCVIMTDYVIKFLTVACKAMLAMLQPCFHNYRQRGKYYLLVESMSQLYRQSVTIVPWLYYLNDSTRTSLWFAFITEAVYLGFKGWSMWKGAQFLFSTFLQFQSNTSFGKKPNSSELLERGNQCPICQDIFNDPLMLPCKHIFCEQCVSLWFDREKTCPMCRAQITTESPLWKDGNTSAHLQWH